jgi:hypothetical protein
VGQVPLMEEPHCCKSLRSNTELIVEESQASTDVNMEAEEVTPLETLARQPMKIRQNEND